MVEYICNDCNKTYHNKYDYNRHLNRKNPCKSDQNNNHQIAPKITKLHHIAPICEIKNVQNNHNIINKQCQYCNKIFTRISSLDRHINDRCKVKKRDDNFKEDLLQKLIEEMKITNEVMKKTNLSTI